MKIFASDYDGTLRCEEFVAEQDKEAIQAWQKEGNLFGIVTGRSMESMREEAKRNRLHADFYVGNNGGAVYDSAFQEMKTYYFPFAKAMDILHYIRSEKIISYVMNDGYYRAKKVIDPTREDKKYANTKTTLSEEEILNKRKIAQIVVSLDEEADGRRIADYINATFHNVAVAYRNVNCVDITPYGISKATGLAYMVHHYQIKREAVYTIGDSYNDIPMLSTFHGFAMANADNQVKSYAKESAGSVNEAIRKVLYKE